MTTEEKTLTPEQISNWRKIIALQLLNKAKTFGFSDEVAQSTFSYALIMPEAEVIAYWKKMKALFEDQEEPEPKKEEPEPKKEEYVPVKPQKVFFKKKCQHLNSIKGSKGRYCLDCECYV